MARLRMAAVDLCWRPAPGGCDRDVTLGILAAVALAWILLIAMLAPDATHQSVRAQAASGGASGMVGMGGMWWMLCMPGTMETRAGSPTGHASMVMGSGTPVALTMWALMVVAMMLPAAIPAIRHVGLNSLRWRRRRAMLTFVAVYFSVWVAFGAVLIAASPLWSSLDGTAMPAVALALAAGWQLTAYKRRALRDCHRPSPLPPRGWRATAGVIRFAALNSLACLRSCWAMMFVMGAATSTMIFWMVAITGIVTTEKLAQKPRRATRTAAGVLLAGAVVAGSSTLIA